MWETKIFKHAKACRDWQERNAQKYLIQEIAVENAYDVSIVTGKQFPRHEVFPSHDKGLGKPVSQSR